MDLPHAAAASCSRVSPARTGLPAAERSAGPDLFRWIGSTLKLSQPPETSRTSNHERLGPRLFQTAFTDSASCPSAQEASPSMSQTASHPTHSHDESPHSLTVRRKRAVHSPLAVLNLYWAFMWEPRNDESPHAMVSLLWNDEAGDWGGGEYLCSAFSHLLIH